MRFERILHPVGQGAFFTEKIKDNDSQTLFCAVYDCGSLNKSLLSRNIEGAFNSDEHIDLLCISHFDKDHINGIDQLLPWCDSKTVALIPFAFPEVLAVCYAPFDQLIKSLRRSSVRIIAISQLSEDSEGTIDLTELRYYDHLASGTKISIADNYRKPVWYYVPLMVADHSSALADFEKSIAKKFCRALLNDPEYVNNNIDDLKKIFQKAKAVTNCGKTSIINMNSLLLLSYPADDIVEYVVLMSHTCRSYRHCCYIEEASCLYTGDTNLSNHSCYDNLLKRVLRLCHEPIGLLQIPHHGSKNNYGIHCINDSRYKAAFVNFKTDSTVFSPNLVKDYWLNRKLLFPVTENPLTSVVLIAEF